jgi:hypothetical protein
MPFQPVLNCSSITFASCKQAKVVLHVNPRKHVPHTPPQPLFPHVLFVHAVAHVGPGIGVGVLVALAGFGVDVATGAVVGTGVAGIGVDVGSAVGTGVDVGGNEIV